MRRLRREQLLPIDLATAWDFFSSPINLNGITPPDMHFAVTSELPAVMYEGLFITYRIKPMLNIPLDWCTEITHIRTDWQAGSVFFVDEQRKGPYRIWHHEHHFETADGGTRMLDLLHYDIGKSVFGWLAGELFVHRRVEEIFAYRLGALEQRFGQGIS